jgi:polyhydroxyalkanoate synthesis regulator phasin
MASKKLGSTAPAPTGGGRKPWKKKTPAEIMDDQTEKIRQQVAEKEEELKELKKQLQKFEEARKIFES